MEIDGKIHENQKEYDELRTYIINNLEKKVIRIKNEELNNINKVIQKLKIYLDITTPVSPSIFQREGD